MQDQIKLRPWMKRARLGEAYGAEMSILSGIAPFNVASACVDSQVGAGLPFDTHLIIPNITISIFKAQYYNPCHCHFPSRRAVCRSF